MPQFVSQQKERLDKFLANNVVAVSRGKIQKAIKSGQITVNSKQITEKDFLLSVGDKVELPEFQTYNLQPKTYNLKIIFENPDLAVIDKPAGLMVHPAAGREDDTLANILISKYPNIKNVGDPHRPGIVHRLDEDTSGLLVVAKTQPGFDYLKGLFLNRLIEKQYLALVHGVPEKLHGMIDEPIGKNSTHQKMKVGVGREAKTEYRLLASDPAGLFSLLLVNLHTGRTHQIRVHLNHIGHPVVGDWLYGGEHKQADKQLIARQFLHARRLKLKLADGTWLELESELPEDLKEVLNKLGIKM